MTSRINRRRIVLLSSNKEFTTRLNAFGVILGIVRGIGVDVGGGGGVSLGFRVYLRVGKGYKVLVGVSVFVGVIVDETVRVGVSEGIGVDVTGGGKGVRVRVGVQVGDFVGAEVDVFDGV